MKEKEARVFENAKAKDNTSINKSGKEEIKIRKELLKKDKTSFNPSSLIFPVF